MDTILKKTMTVIAALMVAAAAKAGPGDEFFSFNAGFLFHNTMNAQVAFEKELNYGNAFELYGEAGNKFKKDPVCGKYCNETFWKNYYWAVGASYKLAIRKGKNSLLRFRIGPQFGAYKRKFAYGGELSFEYDICLKNGVQISLIQKNQININHGDTFRDGLLVGVKIPF